MAAYTPTPQETATEKNRLIGLLKPELKEHGLSDLTDFVNKHSREGFKHPGFVRSLAFRMEELGIVEVIERKDWTEFYIKRTIFSKREPYWYAFRIGLIGIGFSILAGVSIATTQSMIKARGSQSQLPQEFSTIKALNDSVVILRHDLTLLQDSLRKKPK